jgi:hypothetical protein
VVVAENLALNVASVDADNQAFEVVEVDEHGVVDKVLDLLKKKKSKIRLGK